MGLNKLLKVIKVSERMRDNMVLFNLIEEIEKLMEQLKDFVIKNQSNPLMWAAYFLAGLCVFYFTYNALQKEK